MASVVGATLGCVAGDCAVQLEFLANIFVKMSLIVSELLLVVHLLGLHRVRLLGVLLGLRLLRWPLAWLCLVVIVVVPHNYVSRILWLVLLVLLLCLGHTLCDNGSG